MIELVVCYCVAVTLVTSVDRQAAEGSRRSIPDSANRYDKQERIILSPKIDQTASLQQYDGFCETELT